MPDWLRFKEARESQRDELLHSAKGTTWKNHKYTGIVRTSTGKKRYLYGNSDKSSVHEKKMNGTETSTITSIMKKVYDAADNSEKRSILIEAVHKNREDIWKLQDEALDLKEKRSRTYNKADQKALDDQIRQKEAEIGVKKMEIEQYKSNKYWYENTKSKNPSEGSRHK